MCSLGEFLSWWLATFDLLLAIGLVIAVAVLAWALKHTRAKMLSDAVNKQ